MTLHHVIYFKDIPHFRHLEMIDREVGESWLKYYANNLKFSSFIAAKDDECTCLNFKIMYSNFVASKVFLFELTTVYRWRIPPVMIFQCYSSGPK